MSTLAAAAWKRRGRALEEYADPKAFGPGSYAGRVDLYVALGEDEFVIEAKQCWPCAGKRGHSPEAMLNEQLAAACDDVGRVSPRGVRRIGAVFAVPYIAKSEKRDVTELLAKWVTSVKSVKTDAYAWVFPSRIRPLVASDGYLYPGVVLLMRAA